jgi:hypothetical protein
MKPDVRGGISDETWRQYIRCSLCKQIAGVTPKGLVRKHYKGPLRKPANECPLSGDLAANHEVA